MALASCAAGDSYCSKAMSDLAGKNQAVADTVTALMQSETWSSVTDTVKQAAGGNQAALEATGGLLAGIILPGKKLPNAGASIISDSVAFSTKQLDKKFKHAIDFDVITTKKNPDDAPVSAFLPEAGCADFWSGVPDFFPPQVLHSRT